jgi:RNA polymerase sigma-70 factor (ECF subfamily)
VPADEANRSVSSGTSTSRTLLQRLHDDEEAAWERLVTLYAPLVYYWCRKFDLPDQDIGDIVQDVFQSVSAKIHQFRKEKPSDTFRGWLRTISRNKVYDYYRRRGNEPKAVGGTDAQTRFSQVEDYDFDRDEDEEQAASNALFHRALDLIKADFKPNTWEAFWRVVVDGKTPKEVGDELSMQPGNVRVAKSRVLQRLRQELGDLIDT